LTLPWRAFTAIHLYGKLGVDLFFGISGLLITSRLISERKAHGRISLKNFYVRRACRILPAALTYLFVITALTASGVLAVHPYDILAATFFLTNYLPPTLPYFWYVGHFWSLSVEEHFYLLWPSSFRLAGIRFGMALSAGLAITFAAWRTLDSHCHWVSAPWLIGNSARTDYRADVLLWGCTAAFALQAPRIGNVLRRLLPKFWPALAVGSIGALAAFHPRMCLPSIAFLIPTLVLYTLLYPNRLLGKILETSVLRWIGRLSYSLYLWQQIFLPSPDWVSRPSVIQTFPLNIGLVFLLAYLSYRLVERPCIAYGRRRLAAQSVEPMHHVPAEPELQMVPG
jgi:peptidoglycan/LPS O-acetylase OafA/YrhL